MRTALLVILQYLNELYEHFVNRVGSGENDTNNNNMGYSIRRSRPIEAHKLPDGVTVDVGKQWQIPSSEWKVYST